MNTKWLDDLWYFLYKDYGTEIVYTKIGKGVVNLDTGIREDAKTSLQICAVVADISLYQEYLEKLALRAGRPDTVDRSKTRFLVKKSDITVPFETSDYIVHGEKRYMNLIADDLFSLYLFSGVATNFASPYKVLNVSANDQLGLNDGV